MTPSEEEAIKRALWSMIQDVRKMTADIRAMNHVVDERLPPPPKPKRRKSKGKVVRLDDYRPDGAVS